MENTLDGWRRQINQIDEHIANLLAVRMALVRQIGDHKKANGQPIVNQEVEQEKLLAIKSIAEKRGLNPDFLASLFYLVMAEACRVQINNQNGD